MSEHKNVACCESFKNSGGQPALRLRVENGRRWAFTEIQLHGAHVTQWTDSLQPNGQPLIFLSEKAIMDGSAAIRGGIPICFPQFSKMGALPAHGFARNMAWAVDGPIQSKLAAFDATPEDYVEVRLKLSANESTRKIWPQTFEALYTVRLTLPSAVVGPESGTKKTLDGAASRLLCTLSVRSESTFTCALHTYFRVADIHRTTVADLEKTTYLDQLKSNARVTESNAHVKFEGEVDRIYVGAPNRVVVHDGGNNRQISIVKRGFADYVVWNPWDAKARTMRDFVPNEFERMVCVEAACVSILAGTSWSGSIEMTSS